MPFDSARSATGSNQQKKVAVIGSGIAGLSAAWLASKNCDVTLFEAQSRIGGHSNTVMFPSREGDIPVDTGFIVFNEPSYPNLTAMLDHLGVASEVSCMSFGVSLHDGRVEYSGQTLSSVFARKRNAVSANFWRMLKDIPRFHCDAREALASGYPAERSLGDFVAEKNFSDAFCAYFLKPMASAIWSTPQVKIFDYPAMSFFKFFDNHGLLQVLNLPEWHTVSGGSRQYVEKLVAGISGDVLMGRGVKEISRHSTGVHVTDQTGERYDFDDVIIAAHGNEALAMLQDADDQERNILSAFQYQSNRAVLHVDERQMPQRRKAWSSWNYIGDEHDGAVSYWMNRLQNLRCQENVFVTLNPTSDIAPEKVVAAFEYDHPMFNAETQIAQREIWPVQGRGGVWYAGAHLGHGFHEDGLQSGLAVAEMVAGVKRPWSVHDESGRLQLMPDMAAVS